MRPNIDGVDLSQEDVGTASSREIEVTTWPFAGREDAFEYLEGVVDEVTGEVIAPPQVYDPSDPDSPPVLAGCNDADGRNHPYNEEGTLVWGREMAEPFSDDTGRVRTPIVPGNGQFVLTEQGYRPRYGDEPVEQAHVRDEAPAGDVYEGTNLAERYDGPGTKNRPVEEIDGPDAAKQLEELDRLLSDARPDGR